MTNLDTVDLDAGDGRTIKVLNWAPHERKPIGVVQVLHGLGEHARRYDHFASACNAHNLAAVAHNRTQSPWSWSRRGPWPLCG